MIIPVLFAISVPQNAPVDVIALERDALYELPAAPLVLRDSLSNLLPVDYVLRKSALLSDDWFLTLTYSRTWCQLEEVGWNNFLQSARLDLWRIVGGQLVHTATYDKLPSTNQEWSNCLANFYVSETDPRAVFVAQPPGADHYNLVVVGVRSVAPYFLSVYEGHAYFRRATRVGRSTLRIAIDEMVASDRHWDDLSRRHRRVPKVISVDLAAQDAGEKSALVHEDRSR
ncbi:MAG: hypothetical protein HND42_05730 [Armatimonadetes bacterium]|nr:hypothetical protein [Armatimonadota bacterium]NOG92728.1 hypothetical protein [Armatimonadota bacterium]